MLGELVNLHHKDRFCTVAEGLKLSSNGKIVGLIDLARCKKDGFGDNNEITERIPVSLKSPIILTTKIPEVFSMVRKSSKIGPKKRSRLPDAMSESIPSRLNGKVAMRESGPSGENTSAEPIQTSISACTTPVVSACSPLFKCESPPNIKYQHVIRPVGTVGYSAPQSSDLGVNETSAAVASISELYDDSRKHSQVYVDTPPSSSEQLTLPQQESWTVLESSSPKKTGDVYSGDLIEWQKSSVPERMEIGGEVAGGSGNEVSDDVMSSDRVGTRLPQSLHSIVRVSPCVTQDSKQPAYSQQPDSYIDYGIFQLPVYDTTKPGPITQLKNLPVDMVDSIGTLELPDKETRVSTCITGTDSSSIGLGCDGNVSAILTQSWPWMLTVNHEPVVPHTNMISASQNELPPVPTMAVFTPHSVYNNLNTAVNVDIPRPCFCIC
ncbi:hypothetical protein AHF37_02115 [Paragonimus kellicotti]|nr:hypothetical protein AHF37_02115 [Paragonimus kellicotti]